MIALIFLFLLGDTEANKIRLTIGGVFDIVTEPGDENSASMIPIVRMAIRDVNALQILKDYELKMEVKDVKVEILQLQVKNP